ncbi:hypothetical protein ACM614_03260 [Streptomyces sp. 12297]
MTPAEDYENLRRMLDRLPPEQLRDLRAFAETQPRMARYLDEEPDLAPAVERPGFAAFVGMGRSGRTDTARRHRQVIQHRADEDEAR